RPQPARPHPARRDRHPQRNRGRETPEAARRGRRLGNGPMQTHPIFTNILMHSDDELAERLGVEIVEREMIHAWPLSCVQRLLLADGTKRIYKSQLPPTVEPEFYVSASTPLLPDHRLLYQPVD